MTKEQENILENFLKTIGYVKGPIFNYFNELEITTNEIFNLKSSITMLKNFKKEDKEKLIQSQSNISALKKQLDYTEELYAEYVEITKNLQEEYEKTLLFLKREKAKLSYLEIKLDRMHKEQEQIKSVTFDFGPDVRDETGIECTNCGDLDAYEQVNPYTAEIEQRIEMITVCDRCASLIAEEI